MPTIRPATRADVSLILAFIRELALYEREPDAVHATEADLLRDGFGTTPRFHCLIAEQGSTPAGFALYFHNYSTWTGHTGIHLEDLFVRPEHRGQGIGKALLRAVAAIALEEGCPRLEWNVLDWNQPAIDFYHQMGAVMKQEWRGMRVTGEALVLLAGSDHSVSLSPAIQPDFETGVPQGDFAPEPDEDTPKREGRPEDLKQEDFYYEGPYLVFTAAYHMKRGYCCNSDCRHCPYK